MRNFYDPYFVKPNFDIEQVGSKFDFDSVDAETLDRFPFVLTTRASYASSPPYGYEQAMVTESYILWRKTSPVGDREPAERGPEPGRGIACDRDARAERGLDSALFDAEPIRAEEDAWSPGDEPRAGAPASIELELEPGTWDLSLVYSATRPLTLSGPGFERTLPANLDYRGVSPFWDAGRIEVERAGKVPIEAEVAPPAPAGRLLGADSVADLGAIAATRVPRGSEAGPGPGAAIAPLGPRAFCRSAGEASYADWFAPPGSGG